MSIQARKVIVVAVVAWAAIMAACLTGCTMLGQAGKLAGGPLAKAAGAADPRIAAALAIINGPEAVDPFAGAGITYGPWMDSRGIEVVPPITRQAIKTTTETLGQSTAAGAVGASARPENDGSPARLAQAAGASAATYGPAAPAVAPIASGQTNQPAQAAAAATGQPAGTQPATTIAGAVEAIATTPVGGGVAK